MSNIIRYNHYSTWLLVEFKTVTFWLFIFESRVYSIFVYTYTIMLLCIIILCIIYTQHYRYVHYFVRARQTPMNACRLRTRVCDGKKWINKYKFGPRQHNFVNVFLQIVYILVYNIRVRRGECIKFEFLLDILVRRKIARLQMMYIILFINVLLNYYGLYGVVCYRYL